MKQSLRVRLKDCSIIVFVRVFSLRHSVKRIWKLKRYPEWQSDESGLTKCLFGRSYLQREETFLLKMWSFYSGFVVILQYLSSTVFLKGLPSFCVDTLLPNEIMLFKLTYVLSNFKKMDYYIPPLNFQMQNTKVDGIFNKWNYWRYQYNNDNISENIQIQEYV